MFRLIKIRGNSIAPYLKDGDFAVIRKHHKQMSFKIGEFIVFHQNGYGTLIKQIHAMDEHENSLTVHGLDNFSTDSRLFGDISPDQVMGKVIFRIKG
jgi:signal peptidase I